MLKHPRDPPSYIESDAYSALLCLSSRFQNPNNNSLLANCLCLSVAETIVSERTLMYVADFQAQMRLGSTEKYPSDTLMGGLLGARFDVGFYI